MIGDIILKVKNSQTWLKMIISIVGLFFYILLAAGSESSHD